VSDDVQDFLTNFLFWVIGGLTAACAVATVVTHNIVRSATWLLFTLGGTSALFFLIGADLVGAVQLLVYVGGTMVLVVFGVMLTAQGPFISMRTSSAEWAISAATGIALLAALFFAIKSPERPKAMAEPVNAYAPKKTLSDPDDSGNAAKASYTMVIGQGFAGQPVGPAHRDPNPPRASAPKEADAKDAKDAGDEGKKDAKKEAKKDAEEKKAPQPTGIVRANYLLPFEIVSVHLLVVLIAAAFLARAKRVEARS
jgi:NADH-quinone oxidoreductase subunit J